MRLSWRGPAKDCRGSRGNHELKDRVIVLIAVHPLIRIEGPNPSSVTIIHPPGNQPIHNKNEEERARPSGSNQVDQRTHYVGAHPFWSLQAKWHPMRRLVATLGNLVWRTQISGLTRPLQGSCRINRNLSCQPGVPDPRSGKIKPGKTISGPRARRIFARFENVGGRRKSTVGNERSNRVFT